MLSGLFRIMRSQQETRRKPLERSSNHHHSSSIPSSSGARRNQHVSVRETSDKHFQETSNRTDLEDQQSLTYIDVSFGKNSRSSSKKSLPSASSQKQLRSKATPVPTSSGYDVYYTERTTTENQGDEEGVRDPQRSCSPYVLFRGEEQHSERKQQVDPHSDRSPTSLDVEPQSIQEILADFCGRTSSHGIPHIAKSSTLKGKLCWTIVFVLCSLAFTYQTYWTIERYLAYQRIVEIELKFEAAPFPSVTICNLNPYKFSAAERIEDMRNSLNVFKHAVTHSSQGQQAPVAVPDLPVSEPVSSRSKRTAYYHPIRVNCTCLNPIEECIPTRDPFEKFFDSCVCFQEQFSENIWPCYLEVLWTREQCTGCTAAGNCPHPSTAVPAGAINNTRSVYQQPCICQTISNLCMRLEDVDAVIRDWNPHRYISYTYTTAASMAEDVQAITKPSQEAIDQMQIEGLEDNVAITTKAKENMMFIVASLPREIQQNISYQRAEFIYRCSFNSKDCKIENDFRVHMDPIYGSCFTFNFNHTANLLNSRAGPMYGLRVLLNVNQSEYLPSTESAGVRINIHNQTQYPFPDTFGYNAPTGAASSFGLRSRLLERLSEPYGKCFPTGAKTPNYIYDEDYSTEGCYRSCFQNYLVGQCGCGDPRFPVAPGHKTCRVDEINARVCLENMTQEIGDFYNIKKIGCTCLQPCVESYYEVTYSASSWPAERYEVGSIGDECNAMQNGSCFDYFRRSTAFVEVYYEQLNYEYLRETPAYDIVELLADFGGNIGLWIGFSAITVVEFLILFVELVAYFFEDKLPSYRRHRQKRRRRRRRSTLARMERVAYVNTLCEPLVLRSATIDSDLMEITSTV